jgi:hypothetical protein
MNRVKGIAELVEVMTRRASLGQGPRRVSITMIDLETEADIPGIDEATSSKIRAGRQTEMSRVESTGRNGDSPECKAAVADTIGNNGTTPIAAR